MDTGNIIIFLKKFSFIRLVGTGIVLRVFIAIIDGIFGYKLMKLKTLTSIFLVLLWHTQSSGCLIKATLKKKSSIILVNSSHRITNLDFIRGFASSEYL